MDKNIKENNFTGYEVSRKQIERDQKGKIVEHSINGKKYAKVLLPKQVNFGGIEDKDGNAIHNLPEKAIASYLIPLKCAQNHRYNDKKSYISVPKDYRFRINIDYGQSGNILPDGKNEHIWSYIDGVTCDQMKEFHNTNKFVSFTISKKQQGKNYTTQDGSHRTTILLPQHAREYGGCRIACSIKCISEINNHPNIRKVSLPAKAVFAVQKAIIVGENPSTGKPVYDTEIVARLSGQDLSELFKIPEERNLEKTIGKEETIEEEQSLGD